MTEPSAESKELEWAQCEQCAKWRPLPASVEAERLSDQWVCELATWCTLSCATTEKSYTKMLKKAQAASDAAKGVKRKRALSTARRAPPAIGAGASSSGSAAAAAAAAPAAPKTAKRPKKKKKPASTPSSSARSEKSAKAAKKKGKVVKVEYQWVQCDSCHSWRKVPPSINTDSLPERWYCEMNTWDRKRATCSAAEETSGGAVVESGAAAKPSGGISAAAPGSNDSGAKGGEGGRGQWLTLRASHYKSGAHRRSGDKPKAGLGTIMARIFNASSVYQSTVHSGVRKRQKEVGKLAERILPAQPELEWKIDLAAAAASAAAKSRGGGSSGGGDAFIMSCDALEKARDEESAKERLRQTIVRMLSRQSMTHQQLQASCYRAPQHDTSLRLEELLQQGRVEVVTSSMEDGIGLPFYRAAKHSSENVGSVYTAVPLKAMKPWKKRS